ncbi:MAG: hypothetical protein MJ060_02775 [Clostridia bacterium]|nr:hypothetical protein [Clostridia bacterium]
MATVTTVDVTTLVGTDKFPVNANDVYGLIETIASQNIRAVRSANKIVDAFYEYEVENGAVVEEAIIKMAEKQSFVKTGNPDLSPNDPTLAVKYFNNWEEAQFKTTIRRSDIRKIIANKGVGLDDVVSEILASLTEGESDYDYTLMRDIIKDDDVGVNAGAEIFGTEDVPKRPTNAKGILYCLREMYNAVKACNTCGGVTFKQATPVEDIRICISESVLNLIDIVELANAFNLTKEELFGKLVVRPFDTDDDKTKVLVYDRKALGRGTRLYEFSQDVLGVGLYTNHYLTTERCYFYNSLFKALKLDISKAIWVEENAILEEDEDAVSEL